MKLESEAVVRRQPEQVALLGQVAELALGAASARAGAGQCGASPARTHDSRVARASRTACTGRAPASTVFRRRNDATKAPRARCAAGEAVLELGEPHQHDGEQRASIPLVIGQDVQALEDVLVQEVRFIEQEDRVDPFFTELLDMLVDGVEATPSAVT
jgi:hypothetical protein